MLVWETLEDTDKTLANNLSTAFALTSNAVEEEMEMNDRMAQCLIDSIVKGELLEDMALSILTDWKKARVRRANGESEKE